MLKQNCVAFLNNKIFLRNFFLSLMATAFCYQVPSFAIDLNAATAPLASSISTQMSDVANTAGETATQNIAQGIKAADSSSADGTSLGAAPAAAAAPAHGKAVKTANEFTDDSEGASGNVGEEVVDQSLPITTLTGAYVEPEIGGSMAKVGDTSTWHYDELATEDFVNKKAHADALTFGLNGGYGWVLPNTQNIVLQLGAGIYHIGSYKVEGTGYDLNHREQNDPDFNYKYKVRSDRAMAETKILFAHWLLFPYLDAGLGYARNKACSFNATPLKDTEIPSPEFPDATTNRLAYQFGAGAMYQLNGDFVFDLGYRFVNLSDAKLGIFRDQQSMDRLVTKKMHANEINLGVMFLFN